MEKLKTLSINLNHLENGLKLLIDERKKRTLFEVEDHFKNNEARYQLVEGCFYDFEFSNPKYYFEKSRIVQPHSRKKNIGTIAPNIYVGTLSLLIKKDNKDLETFNFEVQSIKADYRNDYRVMLEVITQKCTELLMQANSPVSHYFETDFSNKNKTLYQKFSFVRSIISTPDFSEAIHKIVTSPVTKWGETSEKKDIRKLRRINNGNIKEIIRGSNRTPLPEGHHLNTYQLSSIPTRVNSIRKIDSVDTPENRFVKHALEVFLKFCLDINTVAKSKSILKKESTNFIKTIESHLHHSIFKEISRPSTLKLNSPILQRKEGYREILRVWLMFDLAAKLVWKGGDDIYKAGKKDIAILYEYWLFFKLLDLFESIFEIKPKDISKLIKPTDDGLSLQLKQGNHTALCGVYNKGRRKLHIRFNYNRSFFARDSYPNAGSWTTTMRPDYTLSFWPQGISESQAEIDELIVHIHFDAKYKISNLSDILDLDNKIDLDHEKNRNRKGIYKNADLLKMHAYKDAIRRTGGAYVLYPGDKTLRKTGFHEIIPGLGAFPIRPSKDDNDIRELKTFVTEVIEHLENRASQRENLAYQVFNIHKNKEPNILNGVIPETYGENRNLIPDDTFILIGSFGSKEHEKWIKTNKIFDIGLSSNQEPLVLNREIVSSRYLLLHTLGDTISHDIWKIVSENPKVYSKQDLAKTNYPNPIDENYLVLNIEKVNEKDFKNSKWNFELLKNYNTNKDFSFPFTCSLTELMQSKIN